MKRVKYYMVLIFMFSIYSGYSQASNWLVKPVYYGAGDFSEGLAAVTDGSGKYGYIDKNNNLVIPYHFEQADPFINGIARVKVRKATLNPFTYKYAEFYIDKKGNKTSSAGSYSGENKSASLSEPETYSNGELIGFKDRKGKIIINAQYLSTGGFYYGYAAVNKNGKWGVIDRKGNVIVSFNFDLCGNVSDGVLRVQQNGLWGYIKMPSLNYDK